MCVVNVCMSTMCTTTQVLYYGFDVKCAHIIVCTIKCLYTNSGQTSRDYMKRIISDDGIKAQTILCG